MAAKRSSTDEDPIFTAENEAYGLHSIPGAVPTVSEIGMSLFH